VIDEERVGALAANFVQMWQRSPTPKELDGLIRDNIKEEIYYREAIRLGLDADDAIIRRRLRSKMEFLARAQVANARPDDATLQAWLDRRPQIYAAQARYSFDQIYLNPLKGGDVERRAKSLLDRVNKGGDWAGLGDSISLPKSVETGERQTIARDFGNEFTVGLERLTPGQWAGPIDSGFGKHIVRVRNVQTSGLPKLNDVRLRVENDWRSATMKAREDRAYKSLLDDYTIRIEIP
jgi:hypothetical protein